MRILIVDTYYPAFLHQTYSGQPMLADRPYTEQWQVLMDRCFGTSDFYSSNLIALGHDAAEVVANGEPMQRRWAHEHGLELPPPRTRLALTRRRGVVPWLRRTADDAWLYAVLQAQIHEFRPDVLYVQDMNAISTRFLHEMQAHVRLIAGQTAYPLAAGLDLRPYGVIFSSFPHFIERLREQGTAGEYLRLGFEPRVLARLRKQDHRSLVFVGGLSRAHPARIALLEAVAAVYPVHLWGYGTELLDQNSPLRRHYHGNAWGLAMYDILYNADMALNQHIGVAERNANNMRLYEATGVGTLLITDHKQNLDRLFTPGQEVASYRSVEECLELISHYQSHADERRAVADAGHSRTLREHTYRHRMEELVSLLNRYL